MTQFQKSRGSAGGAAHRRRSMSLGTALYERLLALLATSHVPLRAYRRRWGYRA